MPLSVFDIYSVGLGPSSSHTLGPMRAALAFVTTLRDQGVFDQVNRVQVDLYGSLALTGEPHGTHKAVILGLSGYESETIDSATVPSILAHVQATQSLKLGQARDMAFVHDRDLLVHVDRALPKHANGMLLTAYHDDTVLHQETYYSIGGGFIVTDAQYGQTDDDAVEAPYPFKTAAELWAHCAKQGASVAEIVRANELSMRSETEVDERLLWLADEMVACIERGCQAEPGVLPGPLKVRRRAPALYQRFQARDYTSLNHDEVLCWLNMCAMAVNEENACGGKIITSPTNGAAGIIPAVMNYYRCLSHAYTREGLSEFLLTAGAVGMLYKQQASISGAEMGCQGEVGVACSMAAAGLAAVLGGSVAQVENAAEIAMEHNLGLTCDPVGGLVQIPCIERNAMGAVKAMNAAYLALAGDGQHSVSLDQVIVTMRQTGRDMQSIYKETSLGGLAATVNVPEC